MSKSKAVLEALVRSAMVEGSINSGRVLQMQFSAIEQGRICTRTDYLYTLRPVIYIEPDCVATNFYNEKVYLYKI